MPPQRKSPPQRRWFTVVVNKSTVPVGTGDEVEKSFALQPLATLDKRLAEAAREEKAPLLGRLRRERPLRAAADPGPSRPPDAQSTAQPPAARGRAASAGVPPGARGTGAMGRSSRSALERYPNRRNRLGFPNR